MFYLYKMDTYIIIIYDYIGDKYFAGPASQDEVMDLPAAFAISKCIMSYICALADPARNIYDIVSYINGDIWLLESTSQKINIGDIIGIVESRNV